MKTFAKLTTAIVMSAGLLVGCAPSDVQTGGNNDVATNSAPQSLQKGWA